MADLEQLRKLDQEDFLRSVAEAIRADHGPRAVMRLRQVADALPALLDVAELLAVELDDIVASGHKRLSAEDAAEYGHREGWCEAGDYGCGFCATVDRWREALDRLQDALEPR